MTTTEYRLLEVVGIELEYMIVDRTSLDIRPFADRVLAIETGHGTIAWSNEFVMHVIELKTDGPVRNTAGVAAAFQDNVRRINALLEPWHACLLPTGMHPWMNPRNETRLWPHDDDGFYRCFDALFDCRRHGWANLQAMHVNVSFGNDDEFGRLHAAMRILLPLLPALAASSPVMDGKLTGFVDTRLETYRTNSARVPEATGRVIPERVFTRADYERDILQPIYLAMQPLDPAGILRHEWANARGCIARFDRGALEIRLLDMQESPSADVAIAELIWGVLRALCAERWTLRAEQEGWDEDRLAALLLATMRTGAATRVDDPDYLRLFGVTSATTAGELWRHLRMQVLDEAVVLDRMLSAGTLAQRITAALPGGLTETYARLADTLAHGELFMC